MYTIMKYIEIDAAHRVPEHGSGCRALHGHRYKIEAYCTGQLATEGVQTGMALDFSFLKEEMMHRIHGPCDHGAIFRYDDPIAELLNPTAFQEAKDCLAGGGQAVSDSTGWNRGVKLYLIRDVPTAENLARHWFNLLQGPVHHRSEGRAVLQKIRVWETPTCFAEFGG